MTIYCLSAYSYVGEGGRGNSEVYLIDTHVLIYAHRPVFNRPSTSSEAFDFIKSLIAAPACVVVRPEAGFLEHLEAAIRQADARGNLVFDAQIAALCREHGIGTILTRDRDFKRFDGLQVRVME